MGWQLRAETRSLRPYRRFPIYPVTWVHIPTVGETRLKFIGWEKVGKSWRFPQDVESPRFNDVISIYCYLFSDWDAWQEGMLCPHSQTGTPPAASTAFPSGFLQDLRKATWWCFAICLPIIYLPLLFLSAYLSLIYLPIYPPIFLLFLYYHLSSIIYLLLVMCHLFIYLSSIYLLFINYLSYPSTIYLSINIYPSILYQPIYLSIYFVSVYLSIIYPIIIITYYLSVCLLSMTTIICYLSIYLSCDTHTCKLWVIRLICVWFQALKLGMA